MTEIQRLKQKIKALEDRILSNKIVFESLTEEQLFSEKVLDSLPSIFYLYNQDENLIRCNKNNELLTVFNAQELPNGKCWNGLPVTTGAE